MLGSDRRDYIKNGLAAGGIIAILIAAGFISWGLRQSAEYQRQADNHTREYARNAYAQKRQSCLRSATHEKAKCIAEARHERRANERDEQNLVAQRQSALWAYIMGAAAVIGMGLSVIGIILVWVTFRETKRSADQGKRSVDAFVDAERARIAIIKPEYAYHRSEPQLEIEIRVTNFGRSPCRIRELHWARLRTIIWEPNMTGGPSATKTCDIVASSQDEDWTYVGTINVSLESNYVGGWIKYGTQFSKDCTSYFLWKIGTQAHTDFDGTLYSLETQGGKGWPADT